MIINKCGKFYTIEKNNTETINQLTERSWFIVNNLHLDNVKNKTKEEFEESERNSRLWFNIEKLGCKYDDKLEEKIKDIEKKVFV